VGLDGDSCLLLAQELLAPHVHLELGLDLECCRVVTPPLLLRLIGAQVVQLFYCSQRLLPVPYQLHQFQLSII
jgi:hypothetical protein